jgi:hypothetical protein
MVVSLGFMVFSLQIERHEANENRERNSVSRRVMMSYARAIFSSNHNVEGLLTSPSLSSSAKTSAERVGICAAPHRALRLCLITFLSEIYPGNASSRRRQKGSSNLYTGRREEKTENKSTAHFHEFAYMSSILHSGV